MKKFCIALTKMRDIVAQTLITRPLACFSVITFVFIIMRLYIDIQPLLLLSFFVGLILLGLKMSEKISLLITVFIFFATILGVFSATAAIDRNTLLTNTLDGEHVRVEGNVATVPLMKERGTVFYLDVDKVYHKDGVFDKSFKIYVRCNEENLRFGDRIVFNATLYRSNNNIGQSQTYLAKGAPLCAKDVVVIDVKNAVFPNNIITSARNYIISLGDKFFYGEASMLFKAFAAGDKTSFSDELSGSLSASGLSHITAVSGLHVSVLGLAMFNLLKKRSRLLAACSSFCIVFMFVFITGATPSTVRAAIMFSTFLLAKLIIRENDSITSLCFSAMLLALINPYVIYDWGFILSFMSVLGIMIFSPCLKSLMKALPDYLSDSMSTTVSAQLMTIPALANMFGSLSVYSILANIVVSAVFLIALYLCIIFVFVSFIPFVNTFFAILTNFFLTIIASVATAVASLPYSSASVARFNVYWYIAYYALVLMFIFRKKLSEYVIGAGILICTLLVVLSPMIEDKTVKYEICENSYLVNEEGERVLVVGDNMYDVYLELKDWGGNVWIDTVVVENDAYISEYALDKLNNLSEIDIIVLPRDAQAKVYIQRMGIETVNYEEYSIKTD